MKICPKCNFKCNDPETFCRQCGENISNAPIIVEPQNAPQRPPMPPMPPFQPYYVPPTPKTPFKWCDVSTLVGFVASLVGLFWASILLLPLGIICSIFGFRGNKTRTLAVSGIVISVIGMIVKISIMLYESGVLPEWFVNGIWN